MEPIPRLRSTTTASTDKRDASALESYMALLSRSWKDAVRLVVDKLQLPRSRAYFTKHIPCNPALHPWILVAQTFISVIYGLLRRVPPPSPLPSTPQDVAANVASIAMFCCSLSDLAALRVVYHMRAIAVVLRLGKAVANDYRELQEVGRFNFFLSRHANSWAPEAVLHAAQQHYYALRSPSQNASEASIMRMSCVCILLLQQTLPSRMFTGGALSSIFISDDSDPSQAGAYRLDLRRKTLFLQTSHGQADYVCAQDLPFMLACAAQRMFSYRHTLRDVRRESSRLFQMRDGCFWRPLTADEMYEWMYAALGADLTCVGARRTRHVPLFDCIEMRNEGLARRVKCDDGGGVPKGNGEKDEKEVKNGGSAASSTRSTPSATTPPPITTHSLPNSDTKSEQARLMVQKHLPWDLEPEDEGTMILHDQCVRFYVRRLELLRELHCVDSIPRANLSPGLNIPASAISPASPSTSTPPVFALTIRALQLLLLARLDPLVSMAHLEVCNARFGSLREWWPDYGTRRTRGERRNAAAARRVRKPVRQARGTHEYIVDWEERRWIARRSRKLRVLDRRTCQELQLLLWMRALYGEGQGQPWVFQHLDAGRWRKLTESEARDCMNDSRCMLSEDERARLGGVAVEKTRAVARIGTRCETNGGLLFSAERKRKRGMEPVGCGGAGNVGAPESDDDGDDDVTHSDDANTSCGSSVDDDTEAGVTDVVDAVADECTGEGEVHEALPREEQQAESCTLPLSDIEWGAVVDSLFLTDSL